MRVLFDVREKSLFELQPGAIGFLALALLASTHFSIGLDWPMALGSAAIAIAIWAVVLMPTLRLKRALESGQCDVFQGPIQGLAVTRENDEFVRTITRFSVAGHPFEIEPSRTLGFRPSGADAEWWREGTPIKLLVFHGQIARAESAPAGAIRVSYPTHPRAEKNRVIYDVRRDLKSRWAAWALIGIACIAMAVRIRTSAPVWMLLWSALGGVCILRVLAVAPALLRAHFALKAKRCMTVVGAIGHWRVDRASNAGLWASATESFVVSNVPFRYSSSDFDPGYSRTREHGGPLHPGLKVSIEHHHGRILRIRS